MNFFMFTKLKKIVSKTNVDSTITASDYILLMTIKECLLNYWIC